MKKVLLIEDDVVLRENTAELLELSGYNVETASNGRAGVEVAKKYQPNIIVCDIMMPELDGYGVLDNLSKNNDTKYIPFIFLSAKTERQDIRKGMNMGADDYITKPFNEDELINAIESRIAKAAILQEERQNGGLDNENGSLDEIRTLNDLKNFFDDNGKTFHFSKGDIIYEEGNNSNFVYLIRKGVVKNFKFDHDGKELTTNLFQEDELFGFTSFTQNVPYQESATAIKDCELVAVSKQELKEVLDNNHKITLELVQMLSDNLSGAREQLLDMAYSSVNRKTASTILKFAEKLNNKSGESIKISRNDLASVAGIATETLIRTLSSFKKEGLIEIEARNIKILDIQKLQQIN